MYNIETIKSDLLDLKINYENLKKLLNDTLLIDDKIVEEESLITIIDTTEEIINELNEIII